MQESLSGTRTVFMSNANTTVAANVRAEVARQRIPQVKIAEALSIPQASVSKRLRGLIPFSVDELHALAGFLDVPLADLLAGLDDSEKASA